MIKQIVYYTDSVIDPLIMKAVQVQLKKTNLPIISVSLQPIDFGENIFFPLQRSILTMFKQTLAGIEASTADVLFLCEHDMLYDPSHFDFDPPKENIFYYNINSWKVDLDSGQALYYFVQQTGFLVASRQLLLDHFRARVERVEKEGFRRWNGFEPGGHGIPRGYCNNKRESWSSPKPNIDIRHSTNLTRSRWDKSQFRNPVKDWQMADEVPGWGVTKGRFRDILTSIVETELCQV